MAEPDHRDDRGQFTATVSDDEILGYFAEGRPFHTAQEVADHFDLDRSTAYRRLSDLKDEGRLRKETLGSRTVVWWAGEDEPAPADDDLDEDPFLSMAPGASGTSDVSQNVDEHLADAIAGDSDSTNE